MAVFERFLASGPFKTWWSSTKPLNLGYGVPSRHPGTHGYPGGGGVDLVRTRDNWSSDLSVWYTWVIIILFVCIGPKIVILILFVCIGPIIVIILLFVLIGPKIVIISLFVLIGPTKVIEILFVFIGPKIARSKDCNINTTVGPTRVMIVLKNFSDLP